MLRRRDLASAAAVASLMQFQALPVHAAGPPQQYLSVSGLEKPHQKANGVWQIQDGKELNKRAVYKRQGQEIYFMVNDCGEFQMSKSLTGECTGFARQVSKGKWLIDGTDGKIVVKPGNSEKDAKVEVAMFETAYHPEPLLKKRVNKYSWQEIAQAGGYFQFMKEKAMAECSAQKTCGDL